MLRLLLQDLDLQQQVRLQLMQLQFTENKRADAMALSAKIFVFMSKILDK
jgi:hypothetical protein